MIIPSYTRANSLVTMITSSNSTHVTTCRGSEEKALSIMDDDDETYALLEKLSKRWRLEEHGFLPETLKTAYL